MSGEGDGLVPAGGVPPGGWGGRGATPQVGPAATPGWAAPSSTPEGVGQAQLAASCVTADGGLDLSPPRRRGPRAWLSIASGAVAVAGGVFSAVVWPGWAISVIFEQEALQAGVRTVLVEDYELTVTADMQCPAEVPVVPGQRFACQTMIDGEATEITGVVLSPDGRYQVDRA